MSDDARRPRPRFNRRTQVPPPPTDPEALFGELPRTPDGVGALWSHQADQLRTYAQSHRDTADVALELPTGSGKTLVGLLIADWRRRALKHRVVYACPTKQLARQVLTAALKQGIPAVLLTGAHRSWDQAALTSYTRADAVAITTYSAIFNSNSHLSDAQSLLFDDAHAAEGYVAEAWALAVRASTSAYTELLDALRDVVDPTFIARMVAPEGPAADDNEIRMLPVAATSKRVEQIDEVLGGLSGDSAHRFKMLRANLASCLYYVARSEIYIRPMIPPTFQHAPFTAPSQRVYLSATLGDAGELERAFGRTGIQRVPVPPAWDRTGSGRRFFVFPELSEPSSAPVTTPASAPTPEPDVPKTTDVGTDEQAASTATPASAVATSDVDDGHDEADQDSTLVAELLRLARKRLVLTPDDRSAERIAEVLDLPAEERFDAKDSEVGIQPFLDAETGTLLAANRYDGMDLAKDSCRMMLMHGLPTGAHLQDRFMESKLRAGEVLRERIRTRVQQGAGRCTRGPQDWSVVVVTGEDLLRFLSRAEVRESMPVELQAEISFGLDQAGVSSENLLALAESALLQDEAWREDAEPALAELRREFTRTTPAHVAELSASADREVRAWSAAWQQDWEGATQAALSVLEQLRSPALRAYRALWAYLASAWSALAAGDELTSPAALRSTALLRSAHAAAVGTTWLKEVQALPSATYDADPVDEEAVGSVVTLLQGRYASPTAFERDSARMLADLHATRSGPFENALVTLGLLLGAESFKPAGKGRTDAAWAWPALWITLEAKSEQLAEGLLSMDYVRQTNTQLDLLASDRGVEAAPADSVSVVVSPRRVVDPDAVPIAAAHTYLAAPRLAQDVAHDVVRAYKDMRARAKGVSAEHLRDDVARVLWEHRVLPTQVRERLTGDPIRGS